jgi:predicted permease
MSTRRRAGIRAWLRSARDIDSGIDDEITFHIAMRTQTLVRSGMTQSAAHERAQREFGDADELRRSLRRHDHRLERRRRTSMWWDDLRQDIRFALRTFARAPGFTAVAVGTLVLGIGASAAMFTVVDSVMLRPLPYDEPGSLVRIWPGQNFNIALADMVTATNPALESATGLSQWGLTLTGDGHAAELARAQVVDAGFFDVFRVRPSLGRGFRDDERDPARSDVIILSHELWQTRFGGAGDVVGRRVDVDGYGHQSREVVGVMPRGFVPPFEQPGRATSLWIPLHVPPGRTVATDSTWYVNFVIARLRADATVESAAAVVTTQLQRARADYGGIISEEAVQQAGAAGLLDSQVADTRGALWMLLGAVGLVLLLACANLANLLLARGERRRAELAARAALGGTRGRLVRELLTESAVLAVVGAAGGLLLARAILGVLRVAEASGLPRATSLQLDGRVLAFTVVLTAAALMVFALVPALRVTGGDLRPDLGSGMRTHGGSAATRRVGAALIAVEVALAMILVTGATLLIASFRGVSSIDPGMDTSDVIAVELAPRPTDYDSERALLFYDDLLGRLRALPGVTGAGAIHLLPFTENNWGFPYLAEGHEPPVNAPLPSANFRVVTPTYFDAVDIPLLAGRVFDERDAAGQPAVGIINRTLAQLLWPDQDAVGREILLFGNQPFRVVGVVGDVHQHALDRAPRPELYRPLGQWALSGMVVMVEGSGDRAALADAVRRTVRGIDANVPIVQARPLDAVLGESLARRRFFASVLTFFGALALLLGGVGVYGVMTYTVGSRQAEFSVRMALGATHGDVLRTALRAGLAPVLVGLVAGTAAALAATRLLEALLYGVAPRDPIALLTAALVLGGIAAFASWLPARRVRHVEPMSVLNA